MSDELTRLPAPSAEANVGYLLRLAFQRFRAALERELAGAGLSVQEYGLLSLFAGVGLGWYLRSTNDWSPDCTEPDETGRDGSMLQLPPKTLSR